MSFSRIRLTGWSTGAKLLSTEITQLDIDHANALDKTGDTVASGKTITWASGSFLAMSGTLNVPGNLSTTGLVSFGGGTAVNFNAASMTTFNSGATVTNNTTISVASATGRIQTASGGRFVLGDNDYVTYSAARTPSRFQTFANIVIPNGTTGWVTKLDGLVSTASGASITFALPHALWDGATLSSVDLYVMPAPGAHGASLAGSVTMYRRTLVAGSSPPAWTSIATAGTGVSGWGDGTVKKITITPNVVISGSDLHALQINDETQSGGTYPVAGVYNIYYGVALNYSVADARPQ